MNRFGDPILLSEARTTSVTSKRVSLKGPRNGTAGGARKTLRLIACLQINKWKAIVYSTKKFEKPWRQRCAAVPASRSVNQDCSRDLSDEVAPMAYATSDSSDGIADDADSDSIIRVAVF